MWQFSFKDKETCVNGSKEVWEWEKEASNLFGFSQFLDFKSKETFLKKNHTIKVANENNLFS